MRYDFINKVLRYGIVDARNYRYTAGEAVIDGHYYRIIKRIPKEFLGTTMTLDRNNWEEVWRG